MTPDFLSIGHVCHDTAPLGYIPGGAVTYSTLFAHRLGLETAVLTSVGSDYLFKNLFEDIPVEIIPAASTTLFNNQQYGDKREQHLLARANDLLPQQIPASWKKSKIVFLGPIADEVAPDFITSFENALIGINPQGWMRQWDEKGKVFYKILENLEILSKTDLVVISEEDIQSDHILIEQLAKLIPTLVITKGSKGCDLYLHNKRTSFPAFQTSVVDTTGAGDIFSSALLIFYHKTGNWIEATKYASVASSFCVEGQGIETLPSLQQIYERYKLFKT